MTYPAKVKIKSSLLRQKGYSLNEIASKMKIAKSTASVWLEKLRLSDTAKEILLKKKNNRFFKPNNVEWMKGKKTKPRIWTKQKLNLLKRYYSSGLNMFEVGKRMGVTGSTINHTMRRNNIPRRTFSEACGITFSKKLPSYTKKTSLSLKEKYLHTATLMLYWAEGAKGRHSVDFANSDSKMVTLFLGGLREIYRVLKKNGHFILVASNFASLDNRIISILRFSHPISFKAFCDATETFEGHVRVYIPKEIKKMLIWGGFKLLKLYTFNVANLRHYVGYKKIFKTIVRILQKIFFFDKYNKEQIISISIKE